MLTPSKPIRALGAHPGGAPKRSASRPGGVRPQPLPRAANGNLGAGFCETHAWARDKEAREEEGRKIVDERVFAGGVENDVEMVTGWERWERGHVGRWRIEANDEPLPSWPIVLSSCAASLTCAGCPLKAQAPQSPRTAPPLTATALTTPRKGPAATTTTTATTATPSKKKQTRA